MCIILAEGVALTGDCPVHDPALRILRGEPVNFAGIPALIVSPGDGEEAP